MTRLDTGIDFLCYLDARREFIENNILMVHEELKYFDYYALNFEKIFCSHFKQEVIPIEFIKPVGEYLRKGSNEEYFYSLLVDDIIEKARDVDPSLSQLKFGSISIPSAPKSAYINIVSELSLYGRVGRIMHGKKFFNVVLESNSKGCPVSKVSYKPSLKRVLLFLATQEARDERRKRLFAETELALLYHGQFGAIKAIGIATEPLNRIGRSYDFIYHEIPEPIQPDKKTIELYGQMFGKKYHKL